MQSVNAPITIVQQPVTIVVPPVLSGPQFVPGRNPQNSDYTFQLTDGTSRGMVVRHSDPSSPHTYTIPPEDETNFPISEGLLVLNAPGAAALTIAIDQSQSPPDQMITDGTGGTSSITLQPAQSAYFVKEDTGPSMWRAFVGRAA